MKISGIHYAQNRHMELAIHHERISHVHLTDDPPNPKDERQV